MRSINRIPVALLLAVCCLSAHADDGRGGEVGVVVGAIAADDAMTGDSGSAELTLGLRGGSVFTEHLGWFIDGLYSEIGTDDGLGDARTVVGRTGVDWLFTPQREMRWLVSAGVGWIVVDYEDADVRDFHNPIASIGFGQRIRIADNMRLRWELRGNYTLDDARLEDDLLNGLALVALTWGPRGGPDGSSSTMREADEDGDGVRDRRDRCPATMHGAIVDDRGCPYDDDGDGVPNGIDNCPRSRSDESIGPSGCPTDADGDGVPDVSDVCDDTPARARVDEWGCPKDGDGDSVPDGLDACPDTPRGARVDAEGCPKDGDGDGVVDGVDACPGTQAGIPVGPRGCPLDGDGDGVHDGIDGCPDTPPGTAVVDERGCARGAPLFDEGRTELVMKDVRFELDSATLTASSLEELTRVAAALIDDPNVRVEIGGHTDSTGDDTYNLQLSTRRADSVRERLIQLGVDAERLIARGYGETVPIAGNDTLAGRVANRRVELKKL
jgi:outer membrane protein OmpA-like peptidoglycan-associated protein